MTKQVSNHAAAAKAIKAELKAAFPTVKFSVRSESFSMGDAVRIQWADGPITKQVTAITDKYQYGSFNGMEDIYEHDNRRDDIPQSKYVTTSRRPSEETKAAIAAELGFEGKDLNNGRNEWGEYYAQLIHRAFCQRSFVDASEPQAETKK